MYDTLGSLCLSFNCKSSHKVWMWDDKLHGAKFVYVELYSHNVNGCVGCKIEKVKTSHFHDGEAEYIHSGRAHSCWDEASL